MSHLTDGAARKPIRVVCLALGEKPQDRAPWLVIVKTHGHDFELVATASRHFPPVTLGTDATLEAALERAADAAEKFQIEVVYVTGIREEPSS